MTFTVFPCHRTKVLAEDISYLLKTKQNKQAKKKTMQVASTCVKASFYPNNQTVLACFFFFLYVRPLACLLKANTKNLLNKMSYHTKKVLVRESNIWSNTVCTLKLVVHDTHYTYSWCTVGTVLLSVKLKRSLPGNETMVGNISS